jgi:gamma-glutamyltranspeptidase/glutathione hydrolase
MKATARSRVTKWSVALLAFVVGAAACGQPAAIPPAALSPQQTATAVTTSTALAVAADGGTSPGSPGQPGATPEPRLAAPFVAGSIARSSQGVVTSDNTFASQVARDVLAQGGNAADAAVALAFALAVTFPTAGNVGGGGFAVTRFAGKARALDFRETAPAAASRNMYLDASGNVTSDAREGPRAAGVPGAVAGLWELHQALGSKRKSWAELLAPAVKLARDGFVVDAAFAGSIREAEALLRKFPASLALYFPQGQPPVVGTTFRNPDLAEVLARIAKDGPRGFYQGPTAARIVDEMKRSRGYITAADLKDYRAKWRTPIEFDYRGQHITSMPPPSSGGATLAMICHILEGYSFAPDSWGQPRTIHLVVEAMRRAYAARNSKLGDPDFVKVDLESLMSMGWANSQRESIRLDRATPSNEVPTAGAPSGTGPHTTHFSVVDRDGNAVALTTTINTWFGSGAVVPGTGFVLNNEMDDFAAAPGKPNAFGLVQGELNAIAPGKRMLSSMSPTLVTDAQGQVRLVLGAAGGPRIITAVLHQLLNSIDFAMPIEQAVAAPRFHMQHLPDVISVEGALLTQSSREALERLGHKVRIEQHLADAPGIGRGPGATFVAVGEPRRDSSVALGVGPGAGP